MKKAIISVLFLLSLLTGCGKTYESKEEVFNYLVDNYDFTEGKLTELMYLYTDCSDRNNQFIRYIATYDSEERRIITVNIKMKKHLFNEGPDFVIKGCEIEKVGNYYDSSFVYSGGGFGSDFYITILENGGFSYYEGMLSSYIGIGYYDLNGNELILYENSGRKYVFTVAEDVLVFQKDASDRFTYLDIEDGALFYKKDGALNGE